MAIYAFQRPTSDDYLLFVKESLEKEGISRFFYSYQPDTDLNMLKDMKWDDMNEGQQDSWRHARRLLDIKQGDWIIHINVPEYGKVTAGRVTGEYFFQGGELPGNRTDGRYCFHVADVITFDRNDSRVHPLLSAKLKLRGALWGVYCEKEFTDLLDTLKDTDIKSFPEHYHLQKELTPAFEEFTRIIHKNNPNKQLERFLAEVFRRIPNVVEVRENGYGADHGADLIVYYNDGLSYIFPAEKTLVVQVKSYDGDHTDTWAVQQLEDAINFNDADAGLLITTGNRTEKLEEAFSDLAKKMEGNKVSVRMMADVEVAQFILRYGAELLLSLENKK